MSTAALNDGARRPRGSVLAAIACSGTMAMHVFVPALPAVAREFSTTPAAAQMTLTVYLVGVAGGQLVYGPLSDRFGRRPVLIVSLAVFLFASLVAAFAPGIQWLIGARIVQAVGACGGLVLGRAMARDGATPQQAARQLALLVMVMTASPALAPLPETNLQRAPLPSTRTLLAVYGRLLGRLEFRAYAIGGACMSTSLYAFLSASPFLFTEVLHRPSSEVGLYYMTVIAGVTLGSWLSSKLTGSLGIKGLLRLGASLGMAGAAGMLALDLLDAVSVVGLLATMTVFSIGSGVTSPVATARAISVDPQRIGAASGLYGCLQMAFGALCTLLAGVWHDGTALPVTLILLAASTTSQLAFLVVHRRAD